MRAWIGIQISVDIISHITLIKSTDGVKAFAKSSTSETRSTRGKEGHFLKLTKSIYKIPHLASCLCVWDPPPLSPEVRNGAQTCPRTPRLSTSEPQSGRQERKGTRFGKEAPRFSSLLLTWLLRWGILGSSKTNKLYGEFSFDFVHWSVSCTRAERPSCDVSARVYMYGVYAYYLLHTSNSPVETEMKSMIPFVFSSTNCIVFF